MKRFLQGVLDNLYRDTFQLTPITYLRHNMKHDLNLTQGTLSVKVLS